MSNLGLDHENNSIIQLSHAVDNGEVKEFKNIGPSKYKFHSNIRNEKLFGPVKDTNSCYFAVEYKGHYVKHGDRFKDRMFLFTTFTNEELSFFLIGTTLD